MKNNCGGCYCNNNRRMSENQKKMKHDEGQSKS